MTYTPLWPRNARNGRITLHRDQYPATVSFNTVSTTERSQTARTPWPESDVLVCCSCRLALIVFQQAAQPAPDVAPCPVFHGLLELAKGIAVGCLCLGDFVPYDSGLRSGVARAAMRLHPT